MKSVKNKINYYSKMFLIMILFFMFNACLSIILFFSFRRPLIFNYFAYLFSKSILYILQLKIEINGTENIPQESCVYLFNHQNLLDAGLFGIYNIRNALLLGKKEVAFVPVFGWNFWASGNILLDRKNSKKSHASLIKVTNILKKGKYSIRLFPEGTRNKNAKQFLPFKKGGFMMAAQANVPIIPIVTANYRHLFNPSEKILKRGKININILKPITIPSANNSEIKKCMELTFEKMQQKYLEISNFS